MVSAIVIVTGPSPGTDMKQSVGHDKDIQRNSVSARLQPGRKAKTICEKAPRNPENSRAAKDVKMATGFAGRTDFAPSKARRARAFLSMSRGRDTCPCFDKLSIQ